MAPVEVPSCRAALEPLLDRTGRAQHIHRFFQKEKSKAKKVSNRFKLRSWVLFPATLLYTGT